MWSFGFHSSRDSLANRCKLHIDAGCVKSGRTRPICRGSYARELPRSDCGADGEAGGALGLASTAAFGGVSLAAADSVVGAGAAGGAGGAAAAGACAPLAAGGALA